MTMSNASHEGFSRFVAETGRSLQRYVRRLVGSPAAAEDIMQEAYVRTYQQGERVEQPKAFLFVTARNLAHNARRHQQVAATRSEEHTSELQSLMRISYAVFCLQTKTNTTVIHHTHLESTTQA